jgi:pimeloyl-ACP methyl ester carboxylesterase
MADAELAARGYKFIPGPTGSRGDFVLRKVDDETAAFTFEGPEHFASLAKATFLWNREQLVSLCGLEKLAGFSNSATPYVTPGIVEKEAPVLLLCCGDVPGGDAGSWSRRLTINEGTSTGAMFEYIFRAQERGWSVCVADLHAHDGASSPHAHLVEIWQKLLSKSKATSLLIVGHSYGGPNAVGMLKAEPDALGLLGALVGTDAMAFGWQPATGWTSASLDEVVPSEDEMRAYLEQCAPADREEATQMRERCAQYASSVPAAFAPLTSAAAERLAAVGRNFVSSDQPMGTPIRTEAGKMVLVSAGATEHGSTTNASIDGVFAFLERGAARTAQAANVELVQS